MCEVLGGRQPLNDLALGMANNGPAKAKLGPLAQGGIVLLVYPFCLVANIMSLAAASAPGAKVDPLLLIVSKAFLWGSTFYPVVYLINAAVSVLLARNERQATAHRVAQAPLVYLVGVFLCFAAWMIVGAIRG